MEISLIIGRDHLRLEALNLGLKPGNQRRTIVVFIVMLFIAVVASSDRNWALRRPTYQISTYNSPNHGLCYASRAVDGNNSTIFNDLSCTHTEDLVGGPNWWKVDLGIVLKIRMVVVTNRGDCCPERLDYFIVGLTNSTMDPVIGSYPVCKQYPSKAGLGARITIQCNPNASIGQFVVIQRPSSATDSLSLCEVEVYGDMGRRISKWRRHESRRFVVIRGSVSGKTKSALQCVSRCENVLGCQSVNYFSAMNVCELVFVDQGDQTTDPGWDWWDPIYVFV